MDSIDLRKIKDKYGEKMMHLCRELFPTILDTEGLLFQILSDNFAYSKLLYDDIVSNDKVNAFEYFIYSNVNYLYELMNTTKSPYELLRSVGYTLYECKTKKDILKFKKYYQKDEELCTFDMNKLKSYYVFFAVKDNANDLKREDYINPLREDEYGTSVISIQFRKSTHNAVSIKNRYNHTIPNPDATFYNNLDNIVPGLTKSFELTYGFNICGKKDLSFNLPNYIRSNDGKYYRYNYKIANTYYCSNNIIIINNNTLNIYQDKEKYLLIDYYIIDLQNKTISLYDTSINDSLPKILSDIVKIDIINDQDNKYIYITLKENIITICINKYHEIISYSDEYSTYIPDNFMLYSTKLTDIFLPNVKKIGNNFLVANNALTNIYAPNTKTIGDCFLFSNEVIENIDMPNLKHHGKYSLIKNNKIIIKRLTKKYK